MKSRVSQNLFFVLCLTLLSCALATTVTAQSSGRVALLIGNSEYQTPQMELRNPVNDVTALGAVLEGLGFEVFQSTDQDARAMTLAVDAFGAAARGAEMAVFFYAGHAVQIGGHNHLIGTDFAGSDLDALRQSSVSLDHVRDVIAKAGPQVGVLLLDACRDNPFAEQGLVRQGLVRARGGAGLLIAYATDPGNVAYDGTGDNSVFTTSLLDHIATPGLDIRLMLGRVRQQVVLDTDGRQIPWVEEAVLSDHSFAPTQQGIKVSDQTAADMAHWRSISGSAEITDFETYLTTHPNGLFAAFARDRMALLAADGQALAGPANPSLAQAAPAKVAAALSTLGYGTNADTRGLNAALDFYRRSTPDPSQVTADQLFHDAARTSIFLAATTLQRLRTDIVALRSVERTLAVAEDALRQIETIALTNEDAVPILRQARSDIYDIHRSRGVILRRLDQSRSYYDDLLQQAIVFFPPGVTAAIVAGSDQALANAQLNADAAMFLRHVSAADEQRKGSYQWLADLIPQG